MFNLTSQQHETVDYLIESGEFANLGEVLSVCFQLLRENYLSESANGEPSEIIAQLVATDQFADQDEAIRAGFRLLSEDHISRLVEEARNSPTIENWTADGFFARMEQKRVRVAAASPVKIPASRISLMR